MIAADECAHGDAERNREKNRARERQEAQQYQRRRYRRGDMRARKRDRLNALGGAIGYTEEEANRRIPSGRC